MSRVVDEIVKRYRSSSVKVDDLLVLQKINQTKVVPVMTSASP